MADIQKTLASPSFVIAPAVVTNGIQTVTIPKPTNKGQTIYITGILISASAAPAATVEATLTGPTDHTQAAQTIAIEIPAAAFAMMSREHGSHPIRIKPDTDAVLTIPALGAAVKCAAAMTYYIGPI